MFSEKLIIITLILAICILGFIKIMHERKSINSKYSLVHDFLEKLKIYVESRGEDLSSYSWLVHRSNRMQAQLGRGGIFASYQPPYRNVVYSNYPIILNMLPELRNTFEDSLLSNSQTARQYSMTLHDALIRNIGMLDDSYELNNQCLKNPIIWLREGFRILTAFPLTVLAWLGAMSENTLARITTGVVFKVISSIVAIIGLISAVMGIALGWEQFSNMVIIWLQKLR